MSRGSVTVVGGGILGMTLALELRDRGHPVTIVEAAPELGGLVTPHQVGAIRWDRFYHVILPQDRETLGLISRLGLEGELRWNTTRTGFYVDRQWYSLSNTWEYLRFPPLGLLDKVRLGITILRAAAQRDGVALESIPVTDWLRRWSGERTFERIWMPLLRSKLGDNYRQASAAFIWGYIRRLYAARQSGEKREVMGYVAGGYATILERLDVALRASGVTALVDRRVTEIAPTSGEVVVQTETGVALTSDHAILTIPATRTPGICPWFTAKERERVSRVVYQGVICASLLVRRPLRGFYVTNITDAGLPFTTIVEMTGLVDPATFGGNTLLYLPRYATQTDPWWQKTNAEIEEAFIAGVERMEPGFRRDDILAIRVARARDVQAISTLHYSRDVVPASTTSHPRVHLVNTAQIINGTLNVHETVGLARRKAAELSGRLQRGPTPAPVPVGVLP